MITPADSSYVSSYVSSYPLPSQVSGHIRSVVSSYVSSYVSRIDIDVDVDVVASGDVVEVFDFGGVRSASGCGLAASASRCAPPGGRP